MRTNLVETWLRSDRQIGDTYEYFCDYKAGRWGPQFELLIHFLIEVQEIYVCLCMLLSKEE